MHQDPDRTDEMIVMRNQGKTLQEIGSIFGLTRERVRQLVGGLRAPKPYKRPNIKLTVEIKVFNKINISGINECWEYLGSKLPRGYGVIRKGRTTLYAHRIAYKIFWGDYDSDMCVCHHCDNPSCCNPYHLFLGTHADNVRDREAKGRGRNGRPKFDH